jgi:hypothetical protein
MWLLAHIPIPVQYAAANIGLDFREEERRNVKGESRSGRKHFSL